MTNINKTDSVDQDFIALVQMLDKDLAIRDGDVHEFYNQFNQIDLIKHALVLYENGMPVACGAIKQIMQDTMEIKRMFTKPGCRGKGYASAILKELELWASSLQFQRMRLETGKNQPEAIALYLKNNFYPIENYEQYMGIDSSVCFEKIIMKKD